MLPTFAGLATVISLVGPAQAQVNSREGNALSFQINDVEYARISETAGNVGIGTANPLAKLSVAGNVSVTGMIDVGHTAQACSTAISGSVRYETTSDTLQICTSTGWKSLTSTTLIPGAAAGSTGDIQFNNAGALAADTGELFWDATNNRLGIGTSSPAYPTHIVDTGDILALESTAASDRTTLRYLTNGSDWELGARGSAASPANAFYLYDLAGAAYRLVVANGGNVGIGTAVPGAALEVSGTNALRLAQLGGANNPYIEWYRSGTRQAYMGWGAPGTEFNLAMENGNRLNVIASTTYITGNMGIGTSSPQSKLHVYNDADVWHTRIGGGSGELRIGGQTASGAVIQSVTPGGVARDLYIQRDGGKVGIGTASPVTQLTQASSGEAGVRYLGNGLTGGSAGFFVGYNNQSYLWNQQNTPMLFATNSAERMRIDASGRVGIGTSTPNAPLSVANNVATGAMDNYSEYQMLLYDTGAAYNSYGFGIRGGTLIANTGQLFDIDMAGSNMAGFGNIGSSGVYGLRLGLAGQWQGLGMDGSGSTKTFLMHYGGDADNLLRIARYADNFGGWEANVIMFDMDAPNGSLMLDANGYLGIGSWPTNRLDIADSNGGGAMTLGKEGSFIGYNAYYNGGWKYKANGYGYILRLGASGAMEISGAPNNASGGGAAMTPRLNLAFSNAGNMTVYGTGTTCTLGAGAGATNCTSDARLKDRIQPVTSALDRLSAIEPVTFHWKDKTKDQREFLGLIAQNVETVYPQVIDEVSDTTIGTAKTLDYAALVVPAIAAIKELKAANDNQVSRTQALEHENAALRAANDNHTKAIEELHEEIERLKAVR